MTERRRSKMRGMTLLRSDDPQQLVMRETVGLPDHQAESKNALSVHGVLPVEMTGARPSGVGPVGVNRKRLQAQAFGRCVMDAIDRTILAPPDSRATGNGRVIPAAFDENPLRYPG